MARNCLIMLNNLPQIHFKTTSKRVIQKATEATGDLTGNKLANRIPKISNNAQQYNPETLTNEYDKEIPKEIIDDLRLI